MADPEFRDVEILNRIEDTMLNDPEVMDNLETWLKKSDVAKFFKNKRVFITGGTGFLGSALVEKLLRGCPDIHTLYILIRESKGKNIHTKLDECFESVLFSELKKLQPKFRHKVVPIKGDVALDGMSLSLQDKAELEEEVNVIFHGAASVRFDEDLKTATEINVKGTKELMLLAKKCKKLEVLVHISTAFSNCTNKRIEEKLYPPPMSAESLLELVETTSKEDLDEMVPRLLGDYPNTYTYTKQIAEDTVKEYGKGLPVCIFRPSIIVASYKEPLQGWCSSIYGPSGVIIGAGTGVIRTLHADENIVADLVPIDMCVNGIIASAWHVAHDNKMSIDLKTPEKEIGYSNGEINHRKQEMVTHGTEPLVFNYVSSVQNPTTWGELLRNTKKYGLDCPTVKSIWYYSFQLCKYKWLNLFYSLILHFIPALLADCVLFLIGKKPRLVKLYKKIYRFNVFLSYFTLQQWSFTNDNTQALYANLNKADKLIYNFDMNHLDWDEHASIQIIGLRVYLVKDDLSTLPQAKKKWFRLRVLHNVIKIISILIGLRLLWCFVSLIF